MLKKVLIANRGEVALRVIRACKELGIDTVLVHSTADSNSLPVLLADETICIGPGAADESYLSIPKIIQAAYLTGADGIHPGYGFLSENSEFAKITNQAGITFIGPSPETISLLGDKERARSLMIENNIPVVQGSNTSFKDYDQLKVEADAIGYPLILKAVSGGGGRGMRVIWSEDDLKSSFKNASKEAKGAFGDGRLYMEKFLTNARHIEIQVMADTKGNVVHLGERDCSLQRRHQKIIEEAPAVGLDSDIREEMIKSAIKIARVSDFIGVGTVEFMVEDDKFFFLEVNTRLQVEHTVTEELTGIDIVKEQLRIASGLELSIDQKEVTYSGHVIQCRINGEDIYNDFQPSQGTVSSLLIPGGLGVRFDTHLYDGYQLSPYYDSLLGKLIVRADSRLEAIRKMRVALEGLQIDGLKTNRDLHYGIMHDLDFVRGRYFTNYLENKIAGDFKMFMDRYGEDSYGQ